MRRGNGGREKVGTHGERELEGPVVMGFVDEEGEKRAFTEMRRTVWKLLERKR